MKIPQTKRYSVYKNLVLQDERSYKLNFKPDGRKHYVYRLINLTLDTKENYYGSRSIPKNNPNKDIMENSWKYGTSSKKKKFILENKEIYKVKIVKIFDNPGDKYVTKHFFINILMLNYIVDFGMELIKLHLDLILQELEEVRK